MRNPVLVLGTLATFLATIGTVSGEWPRKKDPATEAALAKARAESLQKLQQADKKLIEMLKERAKNVEATSPFVAEIGQQFSDAAFSPTRPHVVVHGRNEKTSMPEYQLWDAGTGKKIADLGAIRPEASPLVVSPDGSLAAIGTNDQVIVWDLKSAKKAHTFKATPLQIIRRVVFSPDGKTLAIGGHPDLENSFGVSKQVKNVVLWEVATQKLSTNLAASRVAEGESLNTVMDLAFSPDGAILAGSHVQGTLHLWEVKTGKVLHRLDFPKLRNNEPVNTFSFLAFSPDGWTLAIFSNWADADISGFLKLLDLETGKELELATFKKVTPLMVVFSPDGRFLTTLERSQGIGSRVKFWDAKTRQLLKTSQEPEVTGQILAYSPGGLLLGMSMNFSFGFFELERLAPK